MLQKAEKNIVKKETLRNKLQSPLSLTTKDWKEVGQSRLLSTVVLDDIFQKYREYKGADKRKQGYFSPDNSAPTNDEE